MSKFGAGLELDFQFRASLGLRYLTYPTPVEFRAEFFIIRPYDLKLIPTFHYIINLPDKSKEKVTKFFVATAMEFGKHPL